ncbi:preprotein translocase subunit YajC, partial [uncultured Moraxella sp.]|uniref:preprotein translocase subunit YajC n=1 Tax=uncultured Moraxella sp. TaxID=263769 RepID=UPI0025FC51E1
RPQSKRNKQHKAMVDGLAAGNEVVFAGGLIGKIKKVEGDYAVISLGTSEVKVQKASVLMVLPAGTVDNI